MHSFSGRALAALALTALLASGAAMRAQQPTTAPAAASDPFQWLEDVSGDRSMTWVKAQNARTEQVLGGDPHYATYFADALAVAQDPRRLPLPDLEGDAVFNNWRDATNPRGLLRKTTLADYLTAEPHWQPVLDYDALGRAEHVGWVPHARECLYPGGGLCMVGLSAGGEDAATTREFDLRTGRFVAGGFTIPHSKQTLDWADKDTLLIASDWGAGTMTQSGYPFIIKEWKRGTPLASAQEIFRGAATDQLGASAETLHDSQGHSLTIVRRGLTFFSRPVSVRTTRGLEALGIPAKSEVDGLLDGQLLVELNEDWAPTGATQSYPQGSLVSLELAEVVRDPAHLKPTSVFTPSAHEFLETAATTKNHLILTTLEDVQGRASVYTWSNGGWTRKPLPVPANVAVSISTTSKTDDHFFLHIDGFLTPPSIWLGDAAAATIAESKTQPALFDASHDTVEQFFATSRDGTRVPYFVVHPTGMALDGTHPTLLSAYGGFQVSNTPSYSGVTGKLWLENGGVYVLANIRGGGEFGPAWHEAGLKTHRQRIYDDFAAVAQDLITRRITTPRHLGIEGGSNGGLLVGVEMEQHPDLWQAVVIGVPLLDMLGYEHIAAGASWVGEYGSVSNPEERAFLASISPYNQLKPDVHYPEPFLFTTTKDDRVGPQHARKFAAKMDSFHEPFLFEEVIEGGHNTGADLKQQATTEAQIYTYLERKLAEAPASH
ncbi:prolyl oligopeptidase family protein [Acidipila sp. EB88]|uniref:prolyl oligopeptidase family serine peptidase n=1 Tax=Acidipila sp. EB88 TaxID=2305226 RepID=UPI000F5F845E|nr:prolyl oligopeptidase family serine peptidase [Acidipila sp. EB88]RRA48795.1 S9 family peptidase [Acidipila sp. EB88]